MPMNFKVFLEELNEELKKYSDLRSFQMRCMVLEELLFICMTHNDAEGLENRRTAFANQLSDYFYEYFFLEGNEGETDNVKSLRSTLQFYLGAAAPYAEEEIRIAK